jgi:hypothetical protein
MTSANTTATHLAVIIFKFVRKGRHILKKVLVYHLWFEMGKQQIPAEQANFSDFKNRESNASVKYRVANSNFI